MKTRKMTRISRVRKNKDRTQADVLAVRMQECPLQWDVFHPARRNQRLGLGKCAGSFSDLVIHWLMVNQDESILLAGLI